MPQGKRPVPRPVPRPILRSEQGFWFQFRRFVRELIDEIFPPVRGNRRVYRSRGGLMGWIYGWQRRALENNRRRDQAEPGWGAGARGRRNR